MNATINAFPAIHTFNSPRSWAMAIIAVIHAGFFWFLASGMNPTFTVFTPPISEYVPVHEQRPPEKVRLPDEVKLPNDIFTPIVDQPKPLPQDPDENAVHRTTNELLPPPTGVTEPPLQRVPLEIAPDIDPLHALSEPSYPPSAIRAGVEGTVLLSVQVLENGRVGDVRLDKSSGDKRLDESAVREARHWRLTPGTRDGIPVVLWKQIPVTFRLQDTRL